MAKSVLRFDRKSGQNGLFPENPEKPPKSAIFGFFLSPDGLFRGGKFRPPGGPPGGPPEDPPGPPFFGGPGRPSFLGPFSIRGGVRSVHHHLLDQRSELDPLRSKVTLVYPLRSNAYRGLRACGSHVRYQPVLKHMWCRSPTDIILPPVGSLATKRHSSNTMTTLRSVILRAIAQHPCRCYRTTRYRFDYGQPARSLADGPSFVSSSFGFPISASVLSSKVPAHQARIVYQAKISSVGRLIDVLLPGNPQGRILAWGLGMPRSPVLAGSGDVDRLLGPPTSPRKMAIFRGPADPKRSLLGPRKIPKNRVFSTPAA